MKPTLLIASTSLPPICGGAELVAWEIAKRVTDQFEVHMLTSDEGSSEIRHVVELHTVPRVRWMPITYSSIYRYKVEKILKKVSPDITHSHMILPWGYILRDAPALKVITSHDAIVPSWVKRPFIRSALTHADVVTSPSKWKADNIHQEYGRQVITIPNGVETGTFKTRSDIKREDNVVLYVGRFTRNKGALDLLEAARALTEYEFWFRGSALRPSVGGQGVVIPQLPNVKIIDFVPDKHELAALYNRATICAFPSQYENFPLVGLEAMACGRTFVATTGPRNGYSEYVENYREGLLIRPHDIDALVKSIKCLMQNKSMREELEDNAQRKAQQYDWEIVAQKYKALLETLLRQ
jgi:glycosyltransferase involved in cell wall biosynthesis